MVMPSLTALVMASFIVKPAIETAMNMAPRRLWDRGKGVSGFFDRM
jgi:hypothetical protein